MYNDSSLYKIHEDVDTLRIGFHGNVTHTSKFSLGMNAAIEKLSKDFSVDFLAISSSPVDPSLLPSSPQ